MKAQVSYLAYTLVIGLLGLFLVAGTMVAVADDTEGSSSVGNHQSSSEFDIPDSPLDDFTNDNIFDGLKDICHKNWGSESGCCTVGNNFEVCGGTTGDGGYWVGVGLRF
ncbi:hypothetical protein AMJ44_00750 [candidate division WOR-1 bacterium DG_54_3]|uniref:Uncharacterized protein n=1 Tax=candidate division WOR-1 bacterium DG_54_3 TaxID=1703775 RepID=A0A0S7Y677_UNCSA|nr:MAG: hypothetical protein AMJ44_00750 [candidate division WOR-1 bacterium DG_54_3]